MEIKPLKCKIYLPLFFMTAIGSLGCSNQTADKEKIEYIIGIEKDPSPEPFDPTEPPPPPVPFYGPINLILTEKSGIYVHRVFPVYHMDYDDKRAMQVALTKWDIIKVSLEKLPQFLSEEYENVNSDTYRQYITCIKSPSDTIRNEAFPIIVEFFKKKKFDGYIIRKWVDQEQTAISLFDKE